MCLIVDKKQCPDAEPLIAAKNIPVWKVLIKDADGNLWAPYYNTYQYNFELQPHQHIKPIQSLTRDIMFVNNGYHAYTDKEIAQGQSHGLGLSDYMKGKEYVVQPAVVPRGTKYLLGNFEIVSETIKLKKTKVKLCV